MSVDLASKVLAFGWSLFNLYGPTEAAVFSGSLNKKGKVNKEFRLRWCELRGQQIDYYKKEGHRKKQGSIVFGTDAEVAVVSAESAEQHGFPAHCFSIKTDDRTYILQAESAANADGWVSSIVFQRDEFAIEEPTECSDEPAANQYEDFEVEEEKQLHVPWDPSRSIGGELVGVRCDRRQLLQYVLWQRQQLDHIKELVTPSIDSFITTSSK